MLPFDSLSKNDNDERKLATREDKDETETDNSPPEKDVDAANKAKPHGKVKIGSDATSKTETETFKAAPKRARSGEDGEPCSARSKHPRLQHEITGSQGTTADKDAKIDTETTDKTLVKPKDDGSGSNISSGSLSSADSQKKIGSNDDNLNEKPHAEQTISTSEDVLDGEFSDGNLKVSAQAFSRKRGAAAQKQRTHSFPEKLMHLLDSKKGKESMCWLPDGKAFAISPRNFAQNILPKYFEGAKLESFTRKLNRWGFKRVTDGESPGSFTYQHPLFRRGFPTLCRGMNGGKRTENNPLSDAQVQILQMMQGQNAPSDVTLMAILKGGVNPPDPGVPPTLGRHSASSRMMPPLPQLPGLLRGFPSGAAQCGGASTGLEMMMLNQELLRRKAMKNQEELLFQQNLGELIRRKAEEERLQPLLQAQQPSSLGVPPQMLAEIMMRGGPDPSARPRAMFPSQTRSPIRAPATSDVSFPSSTALPPSAVGLAASGDSALMDEFAEFLRLKKRQEALQNWDYQQRLMQQQGRQDPAYQRLLMREEMTNQLRFREGQQPSRQDPALQHLLQEEMVRQLRGGHEGRDPRFGQS
jgi:hypothetical protein